MVQSMSQLNVAMLPQCSAGVYICNDCLCFHFTLATTCIFGTYLQSGLCVVSCESGTIGDSDTRECRNVFGELVVLVISSIVHLYVTLRQVCTVGSVHKCLNYMLACHYSTYT